MMAGIGAIGPRAADAMLDSPTTSDAPFLAGGGAMGARMRAYDWSATCLGAPEGWPQSLKTAASMVLGSKFPACIVWGSDLVTIYNDAFRPILGAKPEALGRPFSEVWSEAWETIGPIADRAFAGEATFIEHFPLMVERNGFPEEASFTFCYSPIRDETGEVVGLLDTVVETTKEVKARAALRAETERLRQLFQQAPGFMCMLSGPRLIFELVNDAYLKLIGHRRDVIGKPLREALPEVEGQGFFELLKGVCTTGEPFVGRNVRVGLQREPESPVEERFVDVVCQPITDDEGHVTGIFAEGYDVTERVLAEAALRASEERFRTALDIETVGVLFFTTNGEITDANDAFLRMTGYSRDDLAKGLLRWDRMTPPEFMPASLRALEELQATGQSTPYEKEYIRKDGSRVWFLFAARMLNEREAVEFALDISERKRGEDHQRLLIHELNHRVKNILTTVQAIAGQAFKGEGNNEARASFEGRLFALARAHDVLTHENWQGAELSDLIDEAIAPYGGKEGGRFEVDGPKLWLNPEMALSLAMALHELATNAAKYGALSVPSGRVVIRWTVAPGPPRHLSFHWREKGGPLVTPPTRKGFGTRLIERSLAQDVSGEVRLTYEPAGVVCVVKASLGEEAA
jgi:PAS domain S-box-containing protein